MEKAKITIDGKDYELLFTLKAAREIIGRYGDLENIEDIFKTRNVEKLFEDLEFMLMTLANQAIMQHNYYNPDDKKELLTIETIELFCDPSDFVSWKEAIMYAIAQGSRRNVIGETTEKKPTAG